MTEDTVFMEGAVCPLPLDHPEQIILGHGSGGRLTHDLIRKVFQPYFQNPALAAGNDFADLRLPQDAIYSRWVTSTDCHIVTPLFFPGGDIGRLAICGTVNDIAMSGAIPLYLTAGFILEEGLAVSTLQKVLTSMQAAAKEAGIKIIAGDTKVVEKGKADGIFITTSGFGYIPQSYEIHGANARPGDAILVSGAIADHGIAVLAARGELGLVIDTKSDVAPLNHLIQTLLAEASTIHVLRDPTRGGLATTLCEIAHQSNVCLQIEEDAVPIHPATLSACELLGFDPLYVANEGKMVVILPEERVEQALSVLHAHPYGREAVRIGGALAKPANRVLLKTTIGGTRIIDMLSGEMLPRIC